MRPALPLRTGHPRRPGLPARTVPARLALLLALALTAALALVSLPSATPSAHAADRTVTLVGDLQSELGCSGDWQPDCTATGLAKAASGSTYSATFTVPAGGWNYKIAINGSWDESYSGDGTKGGGNTPLVLEHGAAELKITYDDSTHQTTITPTDLDNSVTAADRRLAGNSLRAGLTKERYYFLMADRFANGSTANDRGGLTGDRMITGYDPTDKGFYHGGDLKGVTDKLDYIKGLGTTAIWLTPSFKNRPVQGSGADASAGYHGYWITDFTQIDPHLGTNAEMKTLITKAHAKGMKVFFDIITNHTADVIDYADPKAGGSEPYTYISKADKPYLTADGKPFDDRDYLNKQFPTLDPKTSFPYEPVFDTPADATVKVPAWLNDRTLYHNRGNSTYTGENSTYGDFSGLDDLFTENQQVVTGMEDIYKAWVDLGIDGFRIDTVKHVNTEFWQQFSPAILDHAKEEGNDDFFMFGEVYDANPAFMSTYTTTGKLPATLDFGFQAAAKSYVAGGKAGVLRDLFAGDDYYTDTDSNAYELPTFLGNHDMGRLASLLGNDFSTKQKLQRVELANQLMFLTRGQPVTYYGDEQGFIGAGGDKDARQDMFATKTKQYADETNLYGAGAKDRYDIGTSLYRSIRELSKLRDRYPALADGAQISRYAEDGAGVFAFSRVDAGEKREYVVAINNATEAKSADFDTYSSKMLYRPIYGTDSAVVSRADGRVKVTVPALSVSVWRADRKIDSPAAAPVLYARAPGSGADFTGRAKISAALGADEFAQVTFAWRPVGATEWTKLGTDDAAPYAVYHDVSGLKTGTPVEYRMIAKDLRGRYAVTTTSGVVGSKGTDQQGPGDATGPVTQPSAVSVPGDHNSEMGCAADWAPDCDQAQLSRNPNDDIWSKTIDGIPAGSYAYKIAIDKKWDENYGVGGAPNGGNIPYIKTGDGPVTFFYDHRTKNIQNTAQGDLVVAVGSFQSEQGCSADWAPDCLRAWLGDPDGDKVYTWTGTGIPKGDYEFKIALNRSWDVSYGEGGGSANIKLSVPADGLTVQFRYDSTTHVPTAVVSEPPSATDLTKAKAYWVKPGLLAWPADAVPPADQPGMMRWQLQASKNAGITADAEQIHADKNYDLRFDPAGLPAAVVAKFPYLKGYLALRFDGSNRRVAKLIKGQVVIGQYSDGYHLRDGTGVQTALVLDDLYGKQAKQQTYGIDWSGDRGSFRVWAPTAHTVNLLLWPADAAADAPASAATTISMHEQGDGSWTARSPGSLTGKRYLYEITAYQPQTRKIETNLVTDPYSVALTLDSTRSVAIDLDDLRFQPAAWRTSTSPKLAQAVDSTIYELHVRDFSVNDTTVPAAHRGKYLAFADTQGAGWQHLKTLAQAGLNTVHLLPTFDIASIPEDPAEQKTPDCDLSGYAPDSDQQQACVAKVADADAFNWGYDPWHWMTPEGSYASSAKAADGGTRVAEFRTMVAGLHAAGLRVVLDQVYNHTPSSGNAKTSVLDKVVPGYYQRLDANGTVTNSTCCSNVATENTMGEKIMVDSTVLWAKHYKVDGFRYDLMGHHSKANMLAVRSALDKLTVRKDGVDGKAIYLYGEGWNFGEVANNARFEQATQGQLGGTGIGTFSDRLRDAVRGGGPFEDDPRIQGLGSGLGTDPNGFGPDGSDAAKIKKRLASYTDLTQLGLAGNLRAYEFTSYGGTAVRGDQVDYNGSPAGYADQPEEVISYVDAHDNETLFDELTYKLPTDTPMDQRVRANTVALSFTALSQTPSFWHAGTDLLRSKSLDRNSYNSGDWFNTLDWTGADNGFGHGLPPKADNEAKWPYQKPLLADKALKPTAADVATATAQAQDLLKLRFSTPLFRLGSADLIEQKVSFPASGTAAQHDGVIVMRIDDTVGRNVDPRLKGAVVVFNTGPDPVTQSVPGLTGSWQLSPVQAAGADPVVKTARWDQRGTSFTVPGRTVAVFVQRG